jgi:hypothetical protein
MRTIGLIGAGRVDLFRGTLDVMILQTLATLGPLHGYAISARLEQVSGGALHLNMGTLYPGLMRLEQRGLIRADGVSSTAVGARDSMSSLREGVGNWRTNVTSGTGWRQS